MSLDDLDIISNATFAANGYPHEAWRILRRGAALQRATVPPSISIDSPLT